MSLFSDALVDALAQASTVAVLTGAGASAESGIATFRDPDGLWEQFSPQELANVEAFLDNPTLVQGWYRYRQEAIEEAEPNAGHRALARLEALVPEFACITQNVDNLHQDAGTERVIELHGNIIRSYCIECGASHQLDAEVADADEPVRCDECGGLIRPDVVWFGERLPRDAIEAAQDWARAADVFLAVGTSAVVFPAADLPVIALDHGAYVADVNPDTSAVSGKAHEHVQAPAGEALPRLVEAVAERMQARSAS
ncbi:MAG: NAD-dependent deacylase [Longimonas sp.]|uniref:SIR2 family NAD-dependent protein deacylase n=1 Tax=Longimonas sp. TaxID=2039626 RepID=UPI003362AAB6